MIRQHFVGDTLFLGRFEVNVTNLLGVAGTNIVIYPQITGF